MNIAQRLNELRIEKFRDFDGHASSVTWEKDDTVPATIPNFRTVRSFNNGRILLIVDDGRKRNWEAQEDPRGFPPQPELRLMINPSCKTPADIIENSDDFGLDMG